MPPPYERLVFICTNRRPEGAPRPSCAGRGSEAVRDAFKKQLAAKGLTDSVRAAATGCMDACEQGVTVVIQPDDVWYGGVTVDDVATIIEEHVVGGRKVERLLQKWPAAGPRKLPLLRD